MIVRPQRQPETPVTHGSACDGACSVDPVDSEDQDNNRFLYGNCGLGIFPVDPLDFLAFAKGQLIVLAIFVPAAIALFIFLA